jgi:hypothetical protein
VRYKYKSNDEVLSTTYIGKVATKKESQSYDVTFTGDTALFSVNGDMLFRL